uniref:Basigin n=1 Tax=Castor canadensis TaxID=51338 RepID=A0A8C0ZV28_CASCN
MAAAVLLALAFTLLGIQNASAAAGSILTSVEEVDSKTRLTCTLNQRPTEIAGHRWIKDGKVVKEDTLAELSTQYEVDMKDRSGNYSCIFLPESVGKADITVSGRPRIKVVKKSAHADEGETITLACKSESYAPIIEWTWYKKVDSGNQLITNGSQNKYFVNSSETQSELTIKNLEVGSDRGTYVCNGTNSEGSDEATFTVRVHSRLAALWPFLGIVAEVLVLLTIIFMCEKRQKPSEELDAGVLQDDELGSAPLKSSGQVDSKDKNVRQRTAT